MSNASWTKNILIRLPPRGRKLSPIGGSLYVNQGPNLEQALKYELKQRHLIQQTSTMLCTDEEQVPKNCCLLIGVSGLADNPNVRASSELIPCGISHVIYSARFPHWKHLGRQKSMGQVRIGIRGKTHLTKFLLCICNRFFLWKSPSYEPAIAVSDSYPVKQTLLFFLKKTTTMKAISVKVEIQSKLPTYKSWMWENLIGKICDLILGDLSAINCLFATLCY